MHVAHDETACKKVLPWGAQRLANLAQRTSIPRARHRHLAVRGGACSTGEDGAEQT